MFVYGIAKAVNEGWIDKDYIDVAEYGWRGLMTMTDKDYNLSNNGKYCPEKTISGQYAVNYLLFNPLRKFPIASVVYMALLYTLKFKTFPA